MSIGAASLPASAFIPTSGRNFYRLAVNPANNELFVTDAGDYQQRGYVLRYSSTGALISLMQAGIIPGNMYYKGSSDQVIQ
jgi:hypothetical protein